MDENMKFYAVAAGAALLLFFYVKNNALEVGAGVGAAAADLAAGIPIGIGDSIGLPRTNMTKCEQAMAEGRSWDASFDCPASTWLKYMTGMGS